MYQLELTEKQIRNLHEYGNDSTQDFIEEKFPDLFKEEIKIDSLEKAIEYLGSGDEEVTKLRSLETIGLTKYIAEQSLVVWFRAVNKKHEFNWSKGNREDKYFGWWTIENNKARFGGVDYCYSCAVTSLRLCTKTEEQYLELKGNKEFCSLIEAYLVG